MRSMEKLPALLAIMLFLGILAAYDIGDMEESGNCNKGSVAANPIVGVWETSSHVADFLFNKATQLTYGGGGTAKAFYFHENGTYELIFISTGAGPGSIAGTIKGRGKYKVEGNQIIFYNRYESWIDSNYPSKSYKDRSIRDEVKKFDFVRDDKTNETKLRIQTYSNDNSHYTSYSRQKSKVTK